MGNLDLVKQLRAESGAGILACQKALKEANDDYEKAYDILRKQGVASAISKANRTTSEGLCCIASNESRAVIVKLTCETDFVAKNEKFQNLAIKITNVALENNISNIDELLQQNCDGKKVQELITENIASIGENIVVSEIRMRKLNDGEFVSYYVHNKVGSGNNLGMIISAVVASGYQKDNQEAQLLLKQVNMQIVAMSPIALSEDEVDSKIMAREKAIYEEQVAKLNKPADIAKKMIEGKIKKFYEEQVLLQQTFILDNKSSVGDVLTKFNKDNQAELKIISFDRVSIK